MLRLALVVFLLPACNLVRLQQGRLEDQLKEAGIRPATRAVGDAEVAHWEGGSGPRRPVLLIHGFGGSALWTWAGQATALAADRRVVMPDLLWFGGSRTRATETGLDDQVAAIDGLLTALGLAQVDVVGISYGGLVAHELAAAHPDRVGRLVLVDTPGRVFTRDDQKALLARFGTDDFGTVLLPTTPEGVTRLMELAYADPPWMPGFVRGQTLEVMFLGNRAQQAGLLASLGAELAAGTSRAGRVTAETLVVWGRDDPVFPIEVGQRLAASLNAKLEVIDRARHAPHLEHPEAFDRILRAFLDQSTQTPGGSTSSRQSTTE